MGIITVYIAVPKHVFHKVLISFFSVTRKKKLSLYYIYYIIQKMIPNIKGVNLCKLVSMCASRDEITLGISSKTYTRKWKVIMASAL